MGNGTKNPNVIFFFRVTQIQVGSRQFYYFPCSNPNYLTEFNCFCHKYNIMLDVKNLEVDCY